jgi:L-threonylcarbamoyladenylate synthase
MILDGGPCQVGIESTVLSLAEVPPRLFRPGMVTREQLESLIGAVQETGRLENGGDVPHPSPGMHARHYSPRTPLVLLDDPLRLPPGRGICLLRSWVLSSDTPQVRMPDDAQAYAAVLYETLHRLDGEGWDWIVVEAPPETGEWAAVADRLRRAASQA